MLRNEFVFPSADGNTSIHAVQWLPEDDVRAVVQISHGVSEYILRYEAFAQYVTDRGVAVVGHDQHRADVSRPDHRREGYSRPGVPPRWRGAQQFTGGKAGLWYL